MGSEIRAIVKVDADKLRKILAEKGESLVGVSRAMGYGDSYVNNVIARKGGVRPVIIDYIATKYGISYEEYKPVEKPAEPIREASAEQPAPQGYDCRQDLTEIKTALADIALSLHRIGNLEIQLLEKMQKNKREENA